MSAVELIASFVATGRLYGVGVGSTLEELQQRIKFDFVDVLDEDGDSMRRDYGFIEFYLNSGQNWTVSGGSIEMHRLVVHEELIEQWCAVMGEEFPKFLGWDELRTEISRLPDAPTFRLIDQGDFLEYRAPMAKVSVLVNNDHEERGDWLGHGDVWSISLG
ncbi:hypothetical protein ABT282_11340 [Streptomyces sp. NPDC000927]|uniref:hypothetical protein n=1 Tax=Streptomyces sp. NPDC000927 TaxID=3154371 RepID=UPI00331B167A